MTELANGVRIVSHPVTPEREARFDAMRRVATIHSDDEGWVRGFWANEWHFAASKADVLQLLADDLREGRIPI